MLCRCSSTVLHLLKPASLSGVGTFMKDASIVSRWFSLKPASAVEGSHVIGFHKMFWLKPCSLALSPKSPLRIEEPQYEGIRWFLLKVLFFYSKQSKSIRGANVVYQRIISQVDKPAIYEVFHLEKTFKVTFSLLILHMWLFLRRLKQEGKDGADFGQNLYEIYNHDLELRVFKAGVNLLFNKWMKELEKIFYGNIIAYDTAMLPEAKRNELVNVIWRNVFSVDGAKMQDEVELQSVQAMTRYVQREAHCLSLTDKEAIFSGNFIFTSLTLGNSAAHAATSWKSSP